MQALVEHLLRSIVDHPDDIRIHVINGDDAVVFEVIVNTADRSLLESDDGRTLRAIRTVLSAAAGRQKATLDLVDAFEEPSADEE